MSTTLKEVGTLRSSITEIVNESTQYKAKMMVDIDLANQSYSVAKAQEEELEAKVEEYRNKLSIIDFKQSNKPKRAEWIDDYKLQLVAYAMAHDQVYGTRIEQGVILMCTPDNFFQRFLVNGSEFREWKWEWLRRIDTYYGKNVAKS